MSGDSSSSTLLERMRKNPGGRVWEEFQERYEPMLMSLARSRGLNDDDIVDAVHDIFVTVAETFIELTDSFDCTHRPFRAWLLTVARYKIAHIRQRNLRNEEKIKSYAEWLQAHQSPWDTLDPIEKRESERHLVECILREVYPQMSRRDYHVWLSLVTGDKTPEELAKFYDITRGAVYLIKCRVQKIAQAAGRRIREQQER